MYRLQKLLLASVLLLFAGVLLCFAPVKLGATNDFINLYGQSVALRQRLSLYDEGMQTEAVSRLLGVPRGTIALHPNPYPPWYVILFLFLGFFPLHTAARIWFTCNVAMLIGGVVQLTHGLSIRRQFIFLLGCVMFPPVIGLLVVGQTTMPLILGVGLCYYGFRCEKPFAIASGLFLFTLKPHLGILLFLAVFILSLQRLHYFKRMLLWFAVVFGAALVASFVVEPHWMSEMIHALTRWSAVPVNVRRDTCSSLTVELSRQLSLNQMHSLRLGMVNMALAFCALLGMRLSYRKGNIEPILYMAISILLTLLAVPYIRNYDYVLLLVSLAAGMACAQLRMTHWIVLIAYALSFVITLTMPRELQGRFLWIAAALPLFPLVRELRLRTYQHRWFSCMICPTTTEN